MKIIGNIKSLFARAIYIYRINKSAKVKHIGALIRRMFKQQALNDKRYKNLSGRVSQLKLSITKLREDKKPNQKEIDRIDRDIDELRMVFSEMANANDHNTKKMCKRFESLEKIIASINKQTRKDIDELDSRVAIAQQYEENTEKLVELQKNIENKFESYIKEFEGHAMSIRGIDTQFRNAMAIQCQDMVRRINTQISSAGSKPNGLANQ